MTREELYDFIDYAYDSVCPTVDITDRKGMKALVSDYLNDLHTDRMEFEESRKNLPEYFENEEIDMNL